MAVQQLDAHGKGPRFMSRDFPELTVLWGGFSDDIQVFGVSDKEWNKTHQQQKENADYQLVKVKAHSREVGVSLRGESKSGSKGRDSYIL